MFYCSNRWLNDIQQRKKFLGVEKKMETHSLEHAANAILFMWMDFQMQI